MKELVNFYMKKKNRFTMVQKPALLRSAILRQWCEDPPQIPRNWRRGQSRSLVLTCTLREGPFNELNYIPAGAPHGRGPACLSDKVFSVRGRT